MLIPTISRDGVLVAFIIKIATIRIPIAIAISTKTIALHRANKDKEIYKRLELFFNYLTYSMT